MEAQKLYSWSKTHAFTLFLLAVVAVLAVNQLGSGLPPQPFFNMASSVQPFAGESAGMAQDMAVTRSFMPSPMYETAPSLSKDRLVLTDTSLSLLVKDVAGTIQSIRQRAEELGGFLVDSNLNAPEGVDTGAITVRVPSDKREEALSAFRGFAVRVTSENVTGQDVTDQYEDLSAQLAVLEKTKAKIEAILNDAKTVDESLRVQQQLISLQQQIDSIKGRQQYLERSAQMVRITAFLATDETALPYSPDEAWRPQAIFRLAVRSMVGVLQDIGSLVIWVVVFAPLWLPALLFIRWLAKRLR